MAILAAGAVLAKPKATSATKPSDASTTRPAPEKVTVKSVSGIVETRDGNIKNSKWKALKVGDVLGDGSLIRTGLGDAKATLQFDGRDDVTIKQGSKVAISSLDKNGKPDKTKLNVNYGAARAMLATTRCGRPVRTRYGLTYEEAIKAVASMSGDDSRVIRFGCLSICSSHDPRRWGDFFVNIKSTWAVKIRKDSSSISLGQWTSLDRARTLCELLKQFGREGQEPYVEFIEPKIMAPPKSPATTKPADVE